MRTGILVFVKLDTSFGEASSRTQATDPNRRETLRIRTPLPGPRGQAKWLRLHPVTGARYAVECQSSYERGDLLAGTDVFRLRQWTVPLEGCRCAGVRERRGRREACDGL